MDAKSHKKNLEPKMMFYKNLKEKLPKLMKNLKNGGQKSIGLQKMLLTSLYSY